MWYYEKLMNVSFIDKITSEYGAYKKMKGQDDRMYSETSWSCIADLLKGQLKERELEVHQDICVLNI